MNSKLCAKCVEEAPVGPVTESNVFSLLWLLHLQKKTLLGGFPPFHVLAPEVRSHAGAPASSENCVCLCVRLCLGLPKHSSLCHQIVGRTQHKPALSEPKADLIGRD